MAVDEELPGPGPAPDPRAGGGLSPLPREARPFQGRRAGLVTRVVAATIDGGVVGLVLVAGYLAYAGLQFLLDPRHFSMPHSGLFLSLTTGCLVAWAYLAVTWSISGRSYGCLVMGLRVLGRGHRQLRPVTAALRALLCVLVPIGLLWVVVGPGNRSLADLALGTSVVYDWAPRHPE